MTCFLFLFWGVCHSERDIPWTKMNWLEFHKMIRRCHFRSKKSQVWLQAAWWRNPTVSEVWNPVLFLFWQQAEEVQLLRDALRSLRNNLRDHDPQHHTLDTLEQGIVSLIDRLHVLHTHRVLIESSWGLSTDVCVFNECVFDWQKGFKQLVLSNCWDLKSWRVVHLYLNPAGKGKISKTQRSAHRLRHLAMCKQAVQHVPSTNSCSIHGIFMFSLTRFLFITEVCQPHTGSSASTKILYFTGKSPTPSMISIPKRLACVCFFTAHLFRFGLLKPQYVNTECVCAHRTGWVRWLSRTLRQLWIERETTGTTSRPWTLSLALWKRR